MPSMAGDDVALPPARTTENIFFSFGVGLVAWDLVQVWSRCWVRVDIGAVSRLSPVWMTGGMWSVLVGRVG